MKKFFVTSLLGAMLALLTQSDFALADDISVGMPAYGGNGCPSGSASATLSPDSKALSILFDSYQAEAGGVTARRIDRKSCNLAIPVHVPQGYSIAVFQVDYRGFTAIPSGGRAQFNVEYFFAGSQGPRQVKTFNGPSSSDYELHDQLGAAALVWTPCGADTNLRVNSSMMAVADPGMRQTLATVDSADITAGLVYHIQWRRCN
jgi:hypothetical protein